MSAVIGLVGSMVTAAGQREAGAAERRAAEFTAKSRELQAESERDAANVEASDFKRRQGRILASRRAAAGASGLSASSASSLLVDESIMREIALGGARLSHKGMVNSTRLEDDATLNRMRGRSSERAGNMQAGATLLTGAANFGKDVAMMYG